MDHATDIPPKLDRDTREKIDRFLEEYYESGETKKAGGQMAKSKMTKSQVRGLENLVAATPRFSEIINYIKNQYGKEAKDKNVWKTVGPIVLEQLETVEEKAKEIAGENTAQRMEIKLRLAKGWARQVVAHYLYDQKDSERQ